MMNNKVSHVANEVGSKANVEKHVKDGENLLFSIHSIEITISDCCEGGNRPIHGVGVSLPDTFCFEIRNIFPNPGIL